jgi:hypothetical protein
VINKGAASVGMFCALNDVNIEVKNTGVKPGCPESLFGRETSRALHDQVISRREISSREAEPL